MNHKKLYIGKLKDGSEVYYLMGMRPSAAHQQPDSFLCIGRKTVNIDNLPASHAKLLPSTCAHASLADWMPLIAKYA